jgi:hypothetical protein
MVADAAAAAAVARGAYETLCRAAAIREEKIEGIAATLAGVQCDALALQLQADTAYSLTCKVTKLPSQRPISKT